MKEDDAKRFKGSGETSVPEQQPPPKEDSQEHDSVPAESYDEAPIDYDGSKPFIEFLFSWESESENPDGYSALCHGYVCQSCHTQLIEIFADRIFLSGEGEMVIGFMDEDAEEGVDEMGSIFYRINELVLHELAHWAGVGERKTSFAEELAGFTNPGADMPGVVDFDSVPRLPEGST